MSLRFIEHTVDETYTWINEIKAELGVEDAQLAYHALRGVLFTIRDRIPTDEAFDLSAQLPMLIRGLFYEAYKPVDVPEKYRDPNTFLEKVKGELMQAQTEIDPQVAALAVFTVLEKHIDQGEVKKLENLIPNDILAKVKA